MHIGRPEEAIPIIEKGIPLSPYDAGTPGIYQVLGLCHMLRDMWSRQLSYFESHCLETLGFTIRI